MEIPPDALGFAVVIATFIGASFGIKFLIWGKGPIKKLRSGSAGGEAEIRISELEEQVRQLSDQVNDQALTLEDYQERLDFAERVIAQGRNGEARGINPPH